LLEEISKSCRDEGLEINLETAKLIPYFKQMSKTLYTLRKIDKPLEPKETDDIDLTDNRYILTIDAKRYKLFDIKDNETFFDIDVTLATDFSTLQYVYVVYNKMKQQQDSLQAITDPKMNE
jgi:hypothetical protein